MAVQDAPRFWTVVVHDPPPALTGLCAGFEREDWRAAALADYLMESLPEFCLTHSEFAAMTGTSAVQLLRQAASRVYTTDKFRNRGEFGELLLHVVLRDIFGTLPAITKIYYKDAANDTVKGFDAVHVVPTQEGLELWLGEVKFYEDARKAIRDVVKELQKHTQTQYLRSEFVAITNKLDPNWPHSERLKALLHERVSLDQVFEAVCFPVLLTYDGPVIARHVRHSGEYLAEVTEELVALHQQFRESNLPAGVRIHLVLIPLKTKIRLIEKLDEKLRAWQTI